MFTDFNSKYYRVLLISRSRLLFTGVKVALTDDRLSSTATCETDWSECFICKEDKDEKLMYPNVKKEGAAFTTIVENLTQFEVCLYFSLERLDEQGNGIKETLKWNNELACSKIRLSKLKRESMLTK